jgi:hypothetical protein
MPIVLAVGCAPTILARVEAAGRAFSSILACDLASANQLAVDVRPCVIVVTASLFEFDGPKFTDLADDAQAALVVVDDDEAPVDALEARLCDAVNRTRATRPTRREGRYSVVAERESVPSSRRAAVP